MTSPSKIDLTNPNQKIFAGILLAGTLVGLYFLLPPLVFILKNLWIAGMLAIPLIFIIMNPMLMWNIFKGLSWTLTKKLISGDKLGYMYRYHEYLLEKIESLNLSIGTVSAIRIKLTRRIAELGNTIENNKKEALIHQERNSPFSIVKALANKIAIDTKQMESLLPRAVAVENQENSLRKLSEAWTADASDLKYSLDSKAEEYTLLKEISSATGAANEFLKGNSEEYKLYQESLVQIENSATKYIADIENFERKAKPMLENMSAGKEINEQEGMLLIEEFKKNKPSLQISTENQE